MNNSEIEKKLKELGRLLANTTFPQKVVERILDNLDNMTFGDMDILIQSLQNEQDRLSKLAVTMADFAVYVDDRMKIQTKKTLQEISELTDEQQKLMDKDKNDLMDIVRRSKEEVVDA